MGLFHRSLLLPLVIAAKPPNATVGYPQLYLQTPESQNKGRGGFIACRPDPCYRSDRGKQSLQLVRQVIDIPMGV
ncbi:uncharacterized protein J7T54_005534 [Emericellopsis cladophorae]|uniref:Uncharacterized protein n=1 Tax=Emericellopsis cladophorae TaxID=2686198 RepID=A0A9P9Y534_9HYPO|nr:uncharacterized protein J7T54_005534 [Emericellopsis cladophorae]KAI6783505.1 hypothetical protein J7T54_005534 [Emericellopsis cladophorae]